MLNAQTRGRTRRLGEPGLLGLLPETLGGWEKGSSVLPLDCKFFRGKNGCFHYLPAASLSAKCFFRFFLAF